MADGAGTARTPSEIADAERKARAEADLAEQNARAARIAADKAEGAAAASTRQSVAEANAATAKALFPKGETKPLEGKTTQDEKSGFLGDLVAWHAARTCVGEVAARINSRFEPLQPTEQDSEGAPGSPRILIVREMQQLSRSQGSAQFQYQLEQHAAALQELHDGLKAAFPVPISETEPAPPGEDEVKMPGGSRPVITFALGPGSLAAALAGGGLLAGLPPVATGLLAAGSALGLAADAAAFLQADYDVRGRLAPIAQDAIEQALAGEIDAFTVIDGFALLQESSLLRTFSESVVLRDQAEAEFEFVQLKLARAGELKAAIPTLQQRLARESSASRREQLERELATAREEYADLAPWVAPSERLVVRWQAIRPLFDAFAASAMSPAAGDGPSPLHAAALVQFIHESGVTHLLSIRASASGAESVTARHRLAFWKNGSVRYVGGATISFVLAQVNGFVVLADSVTRVEALKHNYWKDRDEPGAVAPDWFSQPLPRPGTRWPPPIR